ncbi:LPXTG cell wall anchor domain-containing protein [Staphylococcus pragensis]|uniref:LPXTG cell wall anchor domain-containing protein n=1 Tax=Staphylococcus pragensis TaxID=1611836 RepID=A0A4Z1BA29_9STAP|nr:MULTISPECIES: LPXTG cell wall anchor domain-containing protein [Staphylococcus]TGN21910.1 LPXTG cell wall anchor domain-containing protein [Staphylococcus pragensis]GGG99221.1 hypothetical protein GCM10007342_23840 [Staphylococcus pragensis]
MKKVSLIASTVLTSTVLLSVANPAHASAAEVVTQDNAQQVATTAMSNSGGNPNLQNFKKAVDKGDYFEIVSQNKLNAGNGVYRVYKNGEVDYKNDKYSQFSRLQDEETHAEHGIAKAAEVEPQHKKAPKVASVDCARELNAYYVGNVDSSEVPSVKQIKAHKSKQHASDKSLPQTGEAQHEPTSQIFGGLFLLLGSAFMINRRNKKAS